MMAHRCTNRHELQLDTVGTIGRSGWRNKPNSLKMLHGDFGQNPNRHNTAESTPEVSSPVCSKHLSGETLTEWKRITEELRSMRVPTKVDRRAIEQYCIEFEMWLATLADLNTHGIIVEKANAKGNTIRYRNPADVSLLQHSMAIHRYLAEFGLTPSSRTRLQIETETLSAREFSERFLA